MFLLYFLKIFVIVWVKSNNEDNKVQHFENVYFDFQVSACSQVQVVFMESNKSASALYTCVDWLRVTCGRPS